MEKNAHVGIGTLACLDNLFKKINECREICPYCKTPFKSPSLKMPVKAKKEEKPSFPVTFDNDYLPSV